MNDACRLSRRQSARRATSIAAAIAALWLSATPWALGACKIKVVGEIAVDTAHNRVITRGEIDGQPVRIGIDTGGWTTWLWSDSAKRLGLRLTYEGRLKLYGVGGASQPTQTLVKHLQIGTINDENLHLIVLDSKSNRPPDAPDLVLGNDVFAKFDTEFDLAHGKVRLLVPQGCTVDELPYWTATYSQADLESGGILDTLIKTRVLVNGKPVDAELDTGSPYSVITREGSATAGVTPWVTDPQHAQMMYGIGPQPVPSWVASFDSFSIGDETIRHMPMRVADMFGADKSVELGTRIAQGIAGLPTMLIGCDFFLTHHLLVLKRQRKLLFTYNGAGSTR